MRGDPEIINVLNDVLAAELTAVNQYFIHAKMCGNWGYKSLESFVRSESIDEMRHAEQLIERIPFFDGTPNLQKLLPIKVGEDVPEQFQRRLWRPVQVVEHEQRAPLPRGSLEQRRDGLEEREPLRLGLAARRLSQPGKLGQQPGELGRERTQLGRQPLPQREDLVERRHLEAPVVDRVPLPEQRRPRNTRSI